MLTPQMMSEKVWNLYSELQKKFGDERAWEFVVSFYKGAGS